MAEEPKEARPTSPGFLNPVAGFGVTFKAMFKKRLTEQYPEQQKTTAPRFHGRHQLNRHPDGLEKCVGCELCAWACPADAIYVEGADNTDEERYSPGERYGRVYQINYARCILCGLCIEACPTRALTMTNEFELADSSRANLIYTKEQLLAGLALFRSNLDLALRVLYYYELDVAVVPHARYPPHHDHFSVCHRGPYL